MADLTSLYQKNPKRDLSIQACVDCLNKIALEFPNEFPEAFFTDYLDISGGTQPPKSQFIHEPKDGYIRFLQIRDFASENTPTYIPDLKKNKICEEKDIVLGRYGASVGKILTGKAGAYNVACAKIIFLKENQVDRDFLFYWLHSSYFQNFLTSISRSAQGGFNKNDVSRIKFNIPSFGMQKKLASIFKEIDNDLLNDKNPNFINFKGNKIELKLISLINKFLNIINEKQGLNLELTHQQNLINQLRQAFLLEAMQGKLVKSTNTKETGQHLLTKIKAEKSQLIAEKKLKKEKELSPISEDEIPFEIPEHWAWCRLGEICTIKGGKRVPNGYSLLKNPTPYVYIRVSDMKNGTISDKDLHYIDEDVYQGIKQYTISKDDIYMTIVGGTIGKCGLIPEKFDNMNLTENAAKISPILVNKMFLYQCLDSPFCQSQIIDKTKQVGVQKMALNRFSSSLIALPPLHEQEQIVYKLEELMAFCDGLEQSVKKSQGYNEQLLQQVLREALEMRN